LSNAHHDAGAAVREVVARALEAAVAEYRERPTQALSPERVDAVLRLLDRLEQGGPFTQILQRLEAVEEAIGILAAKANIGMHGWEPEKLSTLLQRDE
jgi:ABC-type histidine transport system ATPase subunit